MIRRLLGLALGLALLSWIAGHRRETYGAAPRG